MRERLRQARLEGASEAKELLAAGSLPDPSRLADFGAGGPGEAAVRRAFHTAHVPPALLQAAGSLARGDRGERILTAAERYAYWHGAQQALDRETWLRLTRGTAILMYHALGRTDEPASRFVIPAKRFERHLRRLVRRRGPVLPLDRLAEDRRRRELVPAGGVVITLDDGYADNGELAAPLLGRFGLPATVFVVSGLVGGSANWDGAGELRGRRLLDWDALRALRGRGIAVGAHTRTHPRLPELDAADAAEEVEGSRSDLAERLGEPIRAFAYPYGRIDTTTAAAVSRAGFETACGIERGLNYPGTPLHELRRAPIDGHISTLRFVLAVRFGDPDLLSRPLGRLRRAVAGLARARVSGRRVGWSQAK
jgi:Polysaccharide deacetylase